MTHLLNRSVFRELEHVSLALSARSVSLPEEFISRGVGLVIEKTEKRECRPEFRVPVLGSGFSSTRLTRTRKMQGILHRIPALCREYKCHALHLRDLHSWAGRSKACRLEVRGKESKALGKCVPGRSIQTRNARSTAEDQAAGAAKSTRVFPGE